MKDKTNLETCASLGMLDSKTLKSLKDAGLHSYHHNLETSKSFFPCLHDSRIRRGRGHNTQAKGPWPLRLLRRYIRPRRIMGRQDRARGNAPTLDVDCVPINFLNPRPGTPLEGAKNLTPLECLKLIALIRLMLPTKDIIVCGGRRLTSARYKTSYSPPARTA